MPDLTTTTHIMKGFQTALILTIALALGTTAAHAQTYAPVSHDTVYVYNSWAAILDQWPDTMLIDPEIVAVTPYDIVIDTPDEKDCQRMLQRKTVAVAVGDTLWLMNGQYLQRNFKGESKHMEAFVPMYFNAKVVFVQHNRPHRNFGTTLLDLFFETGNYDYEEELYYTVAPLYLLDFENKRLHKVDHNVLSQLLVDYPDLQRRYEGMKDYKQTYMINTFFLDYVNRIMRDPEVPYLIERSEVVPPTIH